MLLLTFICSLKCFVASLFCVLSIEPLSRAPPLTYITHPWSIFTWNLNTKNKWLVTVNTNRGNNAGLLLSVFFHIILPRMSHRWWKPFWDGSSSGSAALFYRVTQGCKDAVWRPWVPQGVFTGRRWPCRCPNIIIAWVVCRTEQTQKPLCAPSPPAAATDSTLHENMQICIKTENISIKLHIPGWCFQGDLCVKKASLSLARRQAAWSRPCQALVSIIHEKCCGWDLLGSV